MTVVSIGSIILVVTESYREGKALKTVKVSITLPEDLYLQIKGLTGNISAFIAEGMRQYLTRVRVERAIEESAGSWAAERHPELEDLEKIANYVREVRAGWRRENG